MGDSSTSLLTEGITALFEAVCSNLPYRMQGPTEAPFLEEMRLVEAIKLSAPLSQEQVALLRRWIDVNHAYCLERFACRMAVHAARTNDVSILCAGALGFVIDDNLVDWRDILMDLSIVEDCALRLHTSVESIMEDVVTLATDKRRSVIQEYLSRSPDMRGLKIMRIAVSGSGDTLTYSRIPW